MFRLPGECVARPAQVRAVQWIAAALACGLLAACADPAPTYYQTFGFQCAQKHSSFAAAMCNKSSDPGSAKVSRYCYKTLADTNCFDRPDPDAKNQPLGSPG
jgi:hypothetical protein